MTARPPSSRRRLTDREKEVLLGAAAGETARETGARLFVSTETVKGHRSMILSKTGAKTTTQALVICLLDGTITLEDVV